MARKPGGHPDRFSAPARHRVAGVVATLSTMPVKGTWHGYLTNGIMRTRPHFLYLVPQFVA